MCVRYGSVYIYTLTAVFFFSLQKASKITKQHVSSFARRARYTIHSYHVNMPSPVSVDLKGTDVNKTLGR